MTHALLVLALLVLAAVGLLFGRRRLVAEPALRVVARAGLTQRAGLALVEVEGRRLLVGYGDGAPRVLAGADLAAPEASDPEVQP